MEPILHQVFAQTLDDWPYFLYLALMVWFSIRYFRERQQEAAAARAEIRRLERLLNARLEQIEARLPG
jgi:hypothetical protein